MNKICYGEDLRNHKIPHGIDLSFLINFYKKSNSGAAFFTNPKFMDLLAGTNLLRFKIIKGDSVSDIYKSWEKDLNKYKTMREKYLLYPYEQ